MRNLVKSNIFTPFLIAFILPLCIGKTDGCPTEEYDYIIVGLGSTGSVLANRLSEDPEVRVLGLEAGGVPDPITDVPMLRSKSLHTKMDWNYSTTPQEACCDFLKNRRVDWNRGHCLGGSSTINGMAYTRGNKRDYDNWAEMGNEGWSFPDVWPYFLKFEDYRVPHTSDEESYHNFGGEMTIEVARYQSPMSDVFLSAGSEIGYNTTDFNAKHQTGFMHAPATMRNGARCSTYHGYLLPIMDRPNVKIEINAFVTKILFDDKKNATGVQYEKDGGLCEFRANKEVIVSAGVINSPQLLQLSGVGPMDLLRKYRIEVVYDLPGVGQNLQDHVLATGLEFNINQTCTLNSLRYETDENLNLWKISRTGPMTVPVAREGLAFVFSNFNTETSWPDLELYYESDQGLQAAKDFVDPRVAAIIPDRSQDRVSFYPIVLRPKSRGSVNITSPNPHKYPLIDPKYLTHPDDIEVLADGIDMVFRLIRTNSFARYGASVPDVITPFCNSKALTGREYLRCIGRHMASTDFHPVGTCKMGKKSDPMAVVDNQLRVYGVQRLRVADASIMPQVVSGHINAACIMIGERVADLIRRKDTVEKLRKLKPAEKLFY